MALSDDKTLEVLYDHYKDSFAQIQRYNQSRNRLLLYVFLGIAGMQLINPAETHSIFGQVLTKHVGVSPQLTAQSVATVLWIAILYGIIRYFQTTLTIDLQYNFLHDIERKLASSLSASEFSRERRGYDSNFRGFRLTAAIFYRIIVPDLFIFSLSSSILDEYNYAGSLSLGVVIDGLIFLFSAFIILFYVWESRGSIKSS